MLADARFVVALRLAVLVPLRLAVVLVLLPVVRLAVLADCVVVVLAVDRAVLLRLTVLAVCVAALLLLLLSSFFIVKNVFVAIEFLNSLVNVCFRFPCASAPSQHRVVLGKTTCHFIKNDVSFCGERRQGLFSW